MTPWSALVCPATVASHEHVPPASSRVGAVASIAEFALAGPSRPSLLKALAIGEAMRQAVIACTDRAWTDRPPARRPAVVRMLELLSGHDSGATDGHASYLAYDEDRDGAIDRLLVHLPVGFDAVAIGGFQAIRRLWLGSDGEWDVRLERVGGREDFMGHPYFGRGREWVSVTPWLHPWYRKKGFGREEQLWRECRLRGWPEPALERLDKIMVGNQLARPGDFTLVRSKRDGEKPDRQPDREGSFWRLTFPEPVQGPVVMGWGRFWGLGITGTTS